MAKTVKILSKLKGEGQKQRTLHQSMKIAVKLANAMGLLPVNGASSDSVFDLNFKWISLKTLYSLLWSSVAITVTIGDGIGLLKNVASFQAFALLLIFVFWILNLALYFCLARKWPKLMQKWFEVDAAMQRAYKYPHFLDFRFRVYVAIYLIILPGTYVSGIISYIIRDKTLSLGYYLQSRFPSVKTDEEHTIFYGIVLQLSNMFAHFAWSFNDMFIMFLGTALALRFRQITQRVKKYGKQMNSLAFWVEIRTDYIRLCLLCNLVNECISLQILLSFVSNFWTILFKLFQSINSNELNNNVLHFLVTFSFALFKTMSTSFYAAWVNDESKQLGVTLSSVLRVNYNSEIKRLLVQIGFDNVALSGSSFFKCTKSLILDIAGAIVTYELVLIQFCAAIQN